MQVCNPDCLTPMVKLDVFNGCNITTRKGGIARLTFLKCIPNLVFPFAGEITDGVEANPWTNLDNVKWAICNDLLFVSGKILGQKPKGSTNKKRLASCEPEETVSGTKTITFSDYNAASDNSLIEYDFWDGVFMNRKFMYLGWITCSDLWYQYTGAWDIENDDVIEQTSDDNTFFDGTITMNTIQLIKPLYIPGLLALINSFTDSTCYE